MDLFAKQLLLPLSGNFCLTPKSQTETFSSFVNGFMTSARSIPRYFLGPQSIIKMFHLGGSVEIGSTSPKVTPSLSIALKPLTARLCSHCLLHAHYFFSATLLQVLPALLCSRGSYLPPCVSNLHLYASVFYRFLSLSLIVLSNLHVSLSDRRLMKFF